MRVEGLVTCLDVYENATGHFALVGMFQDLPKAPDTFWIYFDVRPGAEDDASIIVRVRRAGGSRAIVFDSGEELVISSRIKRFSGAAAVDSSGLGRGKYVVELLIDGSLVASRLIQFGP
jgi:hypothetical protein